MVAATSEMGVLMLLILLTTMLSVIFWRVETATLRGTCRQQTEQMGQQQPALTKEQAAEGTAATSTKEQAAEKTAAASSPALRSRQQKRH